MIWCFTDPQVNYPVQTPITVSFILAILMLVKQYRKLTPFDVVSLHKEEPD